MCKILAFSNSDYDELLFQAEDSNPTECRSSSTNLDLSAASSSMPALMDLARAKANGVQGVLHRYEVQLEITCYSLFDFT